MPSVRSDDPPSPMKLPTCPDCGLIMRFESASPDRQYINLNHAIFVCDCGHKSEQLLPNL